MKNVIRGVDWPVLLAVVLVVGLSFYCLIGIVLAKIPIGGPM